MAEKTKIPPEFANEAQYRAHLDALERDLAGLRHRLVELEGMAATHPSQIAAQKEAIAYAEENLRSYGAKAPAKRTRKARETR